MLVLVEVQSKASVVKGQLEKKIGQLEAELNDLKQDREQAPPPAVGVTTTTPTATVKPTSVVRGSAPLTSRGKPIAQALPVASVSPSPSAKQRVTMVTTSISSPMLIPPTQSGTSIGTATKIVRSVSPSSIITSQVVPISPQVTPSTSSKPTIQLAVSSNTSGPSQVGTSGVSAGGPSQVGTSGLSIGGPSQVGTSGLTSHAVDSNQSPAVSTRILKRTRSEVEPQDSDIRWAGQSMIC